MMQLPILRNSSTIAPQTALGPNTYLSDRDFWRMFGAAFAVHLLVIGIVSLLPDDEVTNIPVRALSFKIGDSDRVAAYSATPSAPVMQAHANIPAMPMTATSDRVSAVHPKPAPVKPVKPQKLEPVKPPQPRRPPLQQRNPEPMPQPVMQAPQAAAIAPTPQQFVREVGSPYPLAPTETKGTPDGAIGGEGAENIQTEKTAQEIRDRYEQQISSWIQRHKLYPAEAGGREGRVVVRMRIDRSGAVRYYALEQTSGVTGIDNAALDMIRRANPVPAAPYNYPGGQLIEFLIPISFHAPR